MMRSGRLRLTQANEFSCNAQAPGDLHRHLQVLASALALHAACEFWGPTCAECEKWCANLLRLAAGPISRSLHCVRLSFEVHFLVILESDLVQLGTLRFQALGLLSSLGCGE